MLAFHRVFDQFCHPRVSRGAPTLGNHHAFKGMFPAKPATRNSLFQPPTTLTPTDSHSRLRAESRAAPKLMQEMNFVGFWASFFLFLKKKGGRLPSRHGGVWRALPWECLQYSPRARQRVQTGRPSTRNRSTLKIGMPYTF
ncbi:hypothetical protein DQ04_03731080 [Trypanosoma grayi]|uniref:hypothetical protein n=1 Tax=Trypanosoma grayi TaxID=71804 RepID=UPI0004F408F1|nr:hypothetical protein DQ04_03731080 [Trypanosoma grayi]KEG10426.1 hypothetical protein DQ04_03731080 [Trypanosoma grayi]